MELTDENFSEHFFDVRKHPKPEKGQILAKWRATADFVDGWVKKNVLELLATNKMGAESAQKIMTNLVGAIEKDSITVCKEMAQDLLSDMTVEAILEKPYRFIIELFYWTKKEYVPKDNPHWTTIDKTIDLTAKVDLPEIENKVE